MNEDPTKLTGAPDDHENRGGIGGKKESEFQRAWKKKKTERKAKRTNGLQNRVGQKCM